MFLSDQDILLTIIQILTNSVNFVLMIHKVTKQGLSAAEFPAVGKFMEKASTETLNAFQFPECQSTLISEQAEKS